MSPSQSDTPGPLTLRDPEARKALEIADDGGVFTPVVYVGIRDDYVILQPAQAVELRSWLNRWLAQREVVDILNAADDEA